jgi:tetratricopeptide (TPR) repeat protein
MNFNAPLNQAIAFLQAGRSAEAVQAYGQIPPGLRTASVWSNLGLAHQQIGELDSALECFAQALLLVPDFVDAWYNQGVTLNHLGRNLEARQAYEKVLALSPSHGSARLNLGICLVALKESQAALDELSGVLADQPDMVLPWYWQGMAFLDLKKWVEAAASFEQAVCLQFDHYDALIGLGNAYLQLAEFEKAQRVLEQALALEPNAFASHYYLGNALRELGQLPQAIAAYEKALTFEPTSVEALANIGVSHERLYDFEQALYYFNQIVEVEPDNPVGLFNSANALADTGRLTEAIERYERLAQIDPVMLGRRVNAAFCYLKLGDFERGWPLYEGRWEKPHAADHFEFDAPLWLGETSLQGKRILLMCEQGFGDTIQFCRYAKQVKNLGAHVILCVQAPLLSLLRSLDHVDELVAKGEELPAFDMYCPLLSLPLAFKTTPETVDRNIPYLSVDAEKVAFWKTALSPASKPIVGVVWQGNPLHKHDFRRSIALTDLARVFSQSEKFDFVVLQNELTPADNDLLAQFPQVKVLPQRTDFAETAALIACVDIVITIDTAVGHLAGALGKVTWLLLASVTDWRWTVGEIRTPWYPSTQLFWQSRAGDWAGTVEALEESMRGWSPPDLA